MFRNIQTFFLYVFLTLTLLLGNRLGVQTPKNAVFYNIFQLQDVAVWKMLKDNNKKPYRKKVWIFLNILAPTRTFQTLYFLSYEFLKIKKIVIWFLENLSYLEKFITPKLLGLECSRLHQKVQKYPNHFSVSFFIPQSTFRENLSIQTPKNTVLATYFNLTMWPFRKYSRTIIKNHIEKSLDILNILAPTRMFQTLYFLSYEFLKIKRIVLWFFKKSFLS